MKGVILTAGKGTRLLPLTEEVSKCMLPIGGISIVQRSLDIMCQFDFIKEICILTNSDNIKQIKEEYGEEYRDRNITYIVQNIQKYGMGTASAILSAKEFINNEKTLIMAGDIIVDPLDVKEMVKLYGNNENSMLLKKVPDPHNFGIVILNEEGKVIDVEEKPENPKSDLINGSVYIICKGDMKYLEGINLSKRNEYEVTDALTKMMLDGKLYGYVAKGYWNDVGTPISVLESNEELMKEMKGTDNSKFNSQIKGEVYIEQDVIIEESEIEGPCYISKGCKIINSKIKPYTYIGMHCEIRNSVIVNSLVLEKSVISNTKMKRCLIGSENQIENVIFNCDNCKFSCVSGPKVKFEPNSIVNAETKKTK